MINVFYFYKSIAKNIFLNQLRWENKMIGKGRAFPERDESVISRDSPGKDSNAQFTTVPLKVLSDQV